MGAESSDDAYFKNMALSQDRTRSILQFAMDLPLASRLTEWAKPLITANGLSSSKLVLNKEGREDAARSRRVEFRLITAACQKAGVYEDESHAVSIAFGSPTRQATDTRLTFAKVNVKCHCILARIA